MEQLHVFYFFSQIQFSLLCLMTPLGTERGLRARIACAFCGTHHAIENYGELTPVHAIFLYRDGE